jgi:hypothetical protein
LRAIAPRTMNVEIIPAQRYDPRRRMTPNVGHSALRSPAQLDLLSL